VVCLEESLYIHNIRDMKVLHTIRDTPPNPAGICSLSANNDNCYLAYPGSNQSGSVEIFDTVNLVSHFLMLPDFEKFLLRVIDNASLMVVCRYNYFSICFGVLSYFNCITCSLKMWCACHLF